MATVAMVKVVFGQALRWQRADFGLTWYKHRDSKNDWRDSCEIKMNNLEFSQLLTNLKNIIWNLNFIPTKSSNLFPF